MGGREKRFSGTTIKDTWTKPRRVEEGEGGGNGWAGGKMQTTVLDKNKIKFKKVEF